MNVSSSVKWLHSKAKPSSSSSFASSFHCLTVLMLHYILSSSSSSSSEKEKSNSLLLSDVEVYSSISPNTSLNMSQIFNACFLSQISTWKFQGNVQQLATLKIVKNQVEFRNLLQEIRLSRIAVRTSLLIFYLFHDIW